VNERAGVEAEAASEVAWGFSPQEYSPLREGSEDAGATTVLGRRAKSLKRNVRGRRGAGIGLGSGDGENSLIVRPGDGIDGVGVGADESRSESTALVMRCGGTVRTWSTETVLYP